MDSGKLDESTSNEIPNPAERGKFQVLAIRTYTTWYLYDSLYTR